MTIFDKVKTILQIKTNEKDELIKLIIDNAESALKTRLNFAKTVPEELNYIVQDLAVSRFNRLKNEGMQSYSQEGETITFKSNDFDDFREDIALFNEKNNTAGSQKLASVQFFQPERWQDNALY